MVRSEEALRQTLKTVLLALVALATLSATPPAHAAAPPYTASGKLAQQFTPIHMVGKTTPTNAEAVALAKRVDVILATRGSFEGQVPAMKQANPRLRLLDYVNAAFAQVNQGPPYYPSSWYARDAQGNFVKSKNFGNWLMDISNVGWINDVVARCKDFVAGDPGYHGCYLDMLGTAPIRVNYVTSKPINKATNTTWSDKEWIAATTALAKKVATGNPNLIVAGNGLAAGTVYFDKTAPTSKLWEALSGAEAEGFVRGATQGVNTYRTEAAWKADVDMLVNAGTRNEVVFALTKFWITATAEQTKRWRKFALATFMLGTNGKSYFRFSTDQTYAGLTAADPYAKVDVGSVSGGYAKIAGTGVYRRTFTKGIALVNPTASAYNVSLGGQYKDLDGVTRTSVTLPPRTGEVFVKA